MHAAGPDMNADTLNPEPDPLQGHSSFSPKPNEEPHILSKKRDPCRENINDDMKLFF